MLSPIELHKHLDVPDRIELSSPESKSGIFNRYTTGQFRASRENRTLISGLEDRHNLLARHYTILAYSCGSENRTHVVQLMRLSWNHLQSIPQFVSGPGGNRTHRTMLAKHHRQSLGTCQPI